MILLCEEVVWVSWIDFGVVILVDILDNVMFLVNWVVLEYLEFVVVDLEKLFDWVCNVGVVFFGYYMFEVIGDYVGGFNYVLLIV